MRNGHLSPTTGAVVESDVIIAESGVRDMDIVTDRNLADKISAGISVGSQWISWGLVKGAEYTGILVEKVSFVVVKQNCLLMMRAGFNYFYTMIYLNRYMFFSALFKLSIHGYMIFALHR